MEKVKNVCCMCNKEVGNSKRTIAHYLTKKELLICKGCDNERKKLGL